MLDRIREILSDRQLTPTQFADTIGVARPIVSHILSGRNKPSLEVVQKIVAAFPDLSLPWLLSGTGSMTTPEVVTASPTPPTIRRTAAKASGTDPGAPGNALAQRDMIESISVPVAATSAPEAVTASFEGPAGSLPLFAAAPPTPSQLDAPSATDSVSVAAKATRPTLENGSGIYGAASNSVVPSAMEPRQEAKATGGISAAALAQPFAEPDKTIRRIVIFYQDGTFTDYQPENK